MRGRRRDVRLDVGDTGVGIPPEVLPQIFEPFFSTKDEESGVGLGLAVVYGIVQRHGGRIDVESEPGRGTIFRLHLPATPRRGPASDARRAATPGPDERAEPCSDEGPSMMTASRPAS